MYGTSVKIIYPVVINDLDILKRLINQLGNEIIAAAPIIVFTEISQQKDTAGFFIDFYTGKYSPGAMLK